ncbi:MAG TPA: energy-coupling factor transporter ATPase, partial [Saccharofermentans sp.]|nr:energy-coupling factor transporter ATPase [Saccharofermentans sp.]
MRPKVLVLDEPASGLDPRGRQGMLRIIESLKATGVTIILVSHYMDEVAEYADRICCMKDGKVIMLGSSTEIFEDIDKVEQMGIKVSRLNMFMRLMLKYNSSINPNVRSVEDAVRQLINTKGVELC